jgi:hypothetical protein
MVADYKVIIRITISYTMSQKNSLSPIRNNDLDTQCLSKTIDYYKYWSERIIETGCKMEDI